MAISLTYQTSAQQTASTTTFTYAGQSIGTATTDRYVVIGTMAAGGGGAGVTVSSITVGGIAATIVVQRNGNSGASNAVTALAIAAVPTGTTATVVVTYSATQARSAIGVWSCTGLVTPDPISTNSSVANPSSLTLSTYSGGFAIGMVGQNAVSTAAWTNLTERFDSTVDSALYSGADSNGTTSGSTLSASCTISTGGLSEQSGVAAAWGNLSATGVNGTGAAGTMALAVSANPVGVAGTGAAGTIVAQSDRIDVPLTGVAGTGQVRAPTLFIDSNIPLVGVAGTGAAGTIRNSQFYTLTGVSGTGAVGEIFPTPPAPTRRARLYIPPHDDYPATIWAGTARQT